MIVIIEGPDGAGKTQLAQRIAADHGLLYHHEGPPPAGVDPLYHYGRILDEARDSNGVSNGVVFDRFALGERVYGPILRGRDGLGPTGWRIFRRLLLASGAHTVLCLPDYETCLRNWASGRPELIHDVTQFRQTYDAWRELSFASSAAIDHVYDFTRNHGPWLVNKFYWPRPLIGSPHGRYLLVGDRGSDPACPTDLAFFGTTDSSAYLTRALDTAGFDEDELVWVNAFRNDGTPNQLPDPSIFKRVIALGAQAAGACARQGVNFLMVPHPQYWRRFHHHDLAGYADQLKEAR